jgi:hypothetical protein
MRLKVLTFLIPLVLALTALSQGVDSPTAANNSSGDWPSITTFALSAVLILTLFAGIPLFFNTWQAHKHLTEMQKSLDAFIMQPGNKIDKDSLIQIIHECVNADPAGAPGTTRGVMALTITLVVGTSLFFLVAYNVNSAVSDSIKEVLLTLTGALTAIIGFYFGGKAGEASQPAKVQPAATKPATAKTNVGWYKIKSDITDGNYRYIAGHNENLSNVPADKLTDWITKKYIEPYTEPS